MSTELDTGWDRDDEPWVPVGERLRDGLEAALDLLVVGANLRTCVLMRQRPGGVVTLAKRGLGGPPGVEEIAALLDRVGPVLAQGEAVWVRVAEGGASLLLAVPVTAGGTRAVLVAVAGCAGREALEETMAMVRCAAVALARLLEMDAASVTAQRQARQLVYEAGTDPLTGLANLRALHHWARSEQSRPGGGSPLAALVIDLDELKWHNDTYGHPAGDQLIRSAGQAMRSVAGAGNLLARVGGDEFLLLARVFAEDELRRLAVDVRQALREAGVRASVGAAWGPPDRWEDTWRVADSRMLVCKRAHHSSAVTRLGRPDRLVLAAGSSPSAA